jgi:hypothetical protein
MDKMDVFRCRKGYVFTISTFFIFSAVLVLALFQSSRVDAVDLSGPKLAMLYDDVRGDILEIYDIDVSLDNSHNLTTVTFEDEMPSDAEYAMSNYESYIEGNYTAHVGGAMADRKGSLAGADIILNMSETALIIEPHGYAYDYRNLSKRDLMVYPVKQDAKLEGLSLNLSLEDWPSSISAHIVPGDMPFSLFAWRGNQTYRSSVLISPNGTSTWEFNMTYMNMTVGQIIVKAGELSVDGVPLKGSASLSLTHDVEVRVETEMAFNQSSLVTVSSQMGAEIRDITGAASLSDKIWFIKE